MSDLPQGGDSVTPIRLEDLQFVVQCRSTQPFFETIAAFNCRQAADGYARDCVCANTQFAYRVTHAFPPIPHASVIEKQIVGRLVADLIGAGYVITVNDGEENVLVGQTKPDLIWDALSSTDADTLIISKVGGHSGGREGFRSFVYLVWGNDADVISDYGTSLEEVLAEAKKLAEALS